MGIERTSNGQERMNKGRGGEREIYEELVLKEQEGESQNEKHRKKRRGRKKKLEIMGLYEMSDVMKVEQLSEGKKIRKSLIVFNQNVMMVLNGEKDRARYRQGEK